MEEDASGNQQASKSAGANNHSPRNSEDELEAKTITVVIEVEGSSFLP